jgi:hypothetical protein
MTTHETAKAMRRVAEVMERLPSASLKDFPQDALQGECAVGAAGLLCYLRDLFTLSDKTSYSQGEILVLLETISRDAEIFPCGTGKLMWAAEVESE